MKSIRCTSVTPPKKRNDYSLQEWKNWLRYQKELQNYEWNQQIELINALKMEFAALFNMNEFYIPRSAYNNISQFKKLYTKLQKKYIKEKLRERAIKNSLKSLPNNIVNKIISLQ